VWQYHLGDALGSVRQVSATGVLVGFSQAFEPYGDPMSLAGRLLTSYGFAGEWRSETELIHLRAREYSPAVGRLIQPDPANGFQGHPSTQHPYTYALDNPVLYIDPSGRVAQAAIAAILAEVFLGAAIGFAVGITLGGIYGALTYEWALARQCGCEIQQQAIGLSRLEWAGAHAIMFGAFGAVAGGIASIAPLAMVAVGIVGVALGVGDLINAANIILSETGLTWCMVTRISLDLLTVAFGALGVAHGVRAWRASGSWLKWGSPQPETSLSTLPRSRIEPFVGIEGENAAGIRARIPSDYAPEFGYFTPRDTVQSIPQYKFTSPDGAVELRVHGPDARFETTWVARIGMRVQEGTPGSIANPYVPGEAWLYYGNTGSVIPVDSPGAMSAMHIRVNVTLQDMIRAFGLGY
jgi:RHS repeat-associated protein